MFESLFEIEKRTCCFEDCFFSVRRDKTLRDN